MNTSFIGRSVHSVYEEYHLLTFHTQ